MRQHYSPPWRWTDAAYALVGVAACIAIAVMAAHGFAPIN